MTFEEILDQTIAMLQRRSMTYRRTARSSRSTRRSAASALAALKRVFLHESQEQPLLLVSRICTGLTPRPKPCSTAYREPADYASPAPSQLSSGLPARLGQ